MIGGSMHMVSLVELMDELVDPLQLMLCGHPGQEEVILRFRLTITAHTLSPQLENDLCKAFGLDREGRRGLLHFGF